LRQTGKEKTIINNHIKQLDMMALECVLDCIRLAGNENWQADPRGDPEPD
jgi:hypothetical protein